MAALPSVQTLRAFEAAARHQSYTEAARELGVTHSAISHRIRELEQRQRSRLFRRSGNRMVATDDGQRLLTHVRTALDLLDLSFLAPAQRPGRQRIAVDVLPAFAVRWLGPRLQLLRGALPTAELELRASTQLSDLAVDGLDAAIRFGPGEWPGVQSRKLSGEVLFPVCTPAYRARLRIRRVRDLARCTLLRHPRQTWTPWLRAARLDVAEPVHGSSFGDAGLLLHAAAADEGVALARGLLVLDDLRAGRLVRLFNVSVPDRFSYCIVRPLKAFPNPVLAAFERWIAATIDADARDIAIRPSAKT